MVVGDWFDVPVPVAPSMEGYKLLLPELALLDVPLDVDFFLPSCFSDISIAVKFKSSLNLYVYCMPDRMVVLSE